MEIKSAEIFKFQYIIQEQDLDVFGHVNNANYLRFYEMARWDFITKNGYGYEKIKESQKGPVLLNVDLQFRKELNNRDQITVESQACQIDGRFMHLRQVIMREDKLCSKAVFTVAYFDMQTRKMLKPSIEWLEACGIILK